MNKNLYSHQHVTSAAAELFFTAAGSPSEDVNCATQAPALSGLARDCSSIICFDLYPYPGYPMGFNDMQAAPISNVAVIQ